MQRSNSPSKVEASKGCPIALAIDATTKVGPERNHPWGEPLQRPAELERRVDQRWEELGLGDVGQQEPDPALFGYVLEQVLERLQRPA